MSSIMSSSRRSQMHSSRATARPSRTPASSRHGGNSNNNNGRQRPSTPEYEPMCTPLNPTGQRALAALLSGPSFQQMAKHLNQAGEKLTEVAAEVNERATDSRVRYDNSRRKKRAERNKKKAASRKRSGDGDESIDDEEQEDEEMEDGENEEEEEEEEEGENEDTSRARKLDQLDEKVKEVTVQLEERMRGIVDGEYKLNAMKEVVEEVHKAAEEAGAEANARERQSRLRSRRHVDEDEEMEDSRMEEDEDEDETVTIIPSQILNDKLNEVDAQWEEQSLGQRYAQNNTYVGFYRIVHDSKHPGDEIPPVPHPSTWFSHLESGMARNGSASPVHGRIRDDQSPDDEDEEIAIERERISLKCPLTFSTFEDPVKSTKCVHSFERQAIQDLIKNSTMTIAAGDQDFQGGGRGARARRVRAVQCPVCSVALTLNDLKRDPVLLRRVLRAKAAEQREEEETQFEGKRHHRKGGRKSGFTIASDDDDEVSIDDDDEDEVEVEDDQEDTRNRIKRERSRYSSRAPYAVDEIQDD